MAVLERVTAALEGKASLQDVDQALQDSGTSPWTMAPWVLEMTSLS